MKIKFKYLPNYVENPKKLEFFLINSFNKERVPLRYMDHIGVGEITKCNVYPDSGEIILDIKPNVDNISNMYISHLETQRNNFVAKMIVEDHRVTKVIINVK